tara:strand:- start:149 stop:1234 length:1086 start_codon:yes stop_codon:yes gene_type:complete
MDTTDPLIIFDDNGRCNHCKDAELLYINNRLLHDENYRENELNKLINNIKVDSGKRKSKYDCIIGLSGGVDSSYTAYKVKELGLNPLAVHFDNTWNSELANNNIEILCDKLEIDLFTHVVDWDEFKDLQLSFLKAGTPDSEVPTDHAIVSLMHNQAHKWRTRYVLSGQNSATESILPKSWSTGQDDVRYMKSILKIFGTKKLLSTPYRIFLRQIFDRFYLIKIPFLNYIDYDKNRAKQFLQDKIGWRDYGGKHSESLYTKIFQSYILPTKFGFDKRKAHLSSLIVAGQISRDTALLELDKPIYDDMELRMDIEYLIRKFDIDATEFEAIMNGPKMKYQDYPNSYGVKIKNLVKKILKFMRA